MKSTTQQHRLTERLRLNDITVEYYFLPTPHHYTTALFYEFLSQVYHVCLSTKNNKTYYQIRSVAQSCPTLCDPMNCSTSGFPVHHQLPEFTETHVHRVSDAIQPSHPLLSPSPPAPNPSQHHFPMSQLF